MTTNATGPDFQGHVFIRSLSDPTAEAMCQRCGWRFTTWEDQQRPCPGALQFDPGVDPGLKLDGSGHIGPVAWEGPELPDLEDLSDAERIGVAVAAMVGAVVDQREQARNLAVELEQQLAEAVRHLDALATVMSTTTTFAHDTQALDAATAFLEAVESPETPDETKDDR